MQKVDADNLNRRHRTQPPKVLDEGAYFDSPSGWESLGGVVNRTYDLFVINVSLHMPYQLSYTPKAMFKP